MQGESLCSLRQAQLIVQSLPCQSRARGKTCMQLPMTRTMGLNNDHLLQEQMTAGLGMDHNRDSRSQMWKCKVPDGARGGMGSPLGCLQNRLLVTIMGGAW